MLRGIKMHFNRNPNWRYRNETFINVDVVVFADDSLISTKGVVEILKELWEFLKHYQ